jgi:HSP20 family molecular chaperone IbpA
LPARYSLRMYACGKLRMNVLCLQNGRYSIEVDIQDFDPEDIEIKVEGGYIVMSGRREVVRGNSTSVRQGLHQTSLKKCN